MPPLIYAVIPILRPVVAMRVYDTMSGEKREFRPLSPPHVGIYVCGLTVYDAMHIGHARTFISFDIIARYLALRGYDVKLVVNITDIDDKIIARAAERGMGALELSDGYAGEFIEDMKLLGVESVSEYVRASDNIGGIIALVSRLVDGGFAYQLGGSVYFDISRAVDYGRLSGQSMDQILAGARVEVDERKRNPGDFALWKEAKPGEVSWESPWGKGRPGWHIECSAMSMKYLGETLDIHGGGEDLIFPHHENEIQQSEACTGKQFARYWMHVGMLNVSGAKMSKSLRNFSPVRETLRQHSVEAVRFYFANSLYRRQIDFSDNSLEESGQAVKRLEGYVFSLLSSRGSGDGNGIAGAIKSGFESAMDDDFNSRDAIASLFAGMKEAAKLAEEGRLSGSAAGEILGAVRYVNSVLGVIRPAAFEKMKADSEVERLIEEREGARRSGNFARADEIRERLDSMGILLEDTAGGIRWRRK